jgi:hypothetical protein
MPDSNSISILLLAIGASTLLSQPWRRIQRLVLHRRLRRSLQGAVRRELARGSGHALKHGHASRPLPGPGGEDLAA